jgi:multidrug resistance efflux pump
MEMMEKPGSTRILWILPEGTRVQGQHLVAEPGHDAPLVPVLLGYVPVQAGDVVCELDASAFRTELEAQHIRHAQARAWVQQARAILEVSQISLREYRDGVYPQDQELIRQYVTTCRTEQVRAKAALVWSQDALRKHVRTPSQLQVDRLVAERAEIALSEAMRMQERLERYTAPRLLKSLEAKIAAVQSDLLTQQSAFLLEDERLRQLQAMVDHCIMRAPRDGVVVYAKQSNGWGRVEDQIREGVTVREGQPIFNLPDPNRMSVQVRVNESKVSLIRSGQRAVIRIDAFPDRPLGGTVAEVTPIPAPASGPGSDIKIYYALVTIDQGGFEGLRPGLSAEVSFLIGTRPGVTRVPVQAVRWVEGRPLVALETATGVRWRPIAVGTTGAGYAEVLSGLAPGERVVADPATLPPPEPVLARAD